MCVSSSEAWPKRLALRRAPSCARLRFRRVWRGARAGVPRELVRAIKHAAGRMHRSMNRHRRVGTPLRCPHPSAEPPAGGGRLATCTGDLLTRPSGYLPRCAIPERTTRSPRRLRASPGDCANKPTRTVRGSGSSNCRTIRQVAPSSAYCIPNASPTRQTCSQRSGTVKSTPLASSERFLVTTLTAAVVPKSVLSKQSSAHCSSS